MANVVLIRPSSGSYYRHTLVGSAVTLSPPLNLASLAASLEAAHHRVVILDLERFPRLDLSLALRKIGPDLVGVTFRSPQLAQARRLAHLAGRLCPGAILVAGGPHPSAMPAETLDTTGFHVVVRGEGEHVLPRLLETTSWPDLPGLTWKNGSTADAPPIANLDALPLPAWHLTPVWAYARPSLVAPWVPVADLETSRGCPGRCVYCSKAVFGSRFRSFSVQRSVDSVQQALESGFRAFNLVDDAFSTDLPRATAFCGEILRRGLQVPWTCTNGLRVDSVDAPFFRLARRAGCWLVAFGFESGDPEVLRKTGKGADLEQARLAVRWARDAGMVTIGYFMLGLPGDRPDTMRRTIRFSTTLGLDLAKYSLALPLPGTPLYRRWSAWLNPARKSDPGRFSIHEVQPGWFRHPETSWTRLSWERRHAFLRFYGRPMPVARTILKLLRCRVLSSRPYPAMRVGQYRSRRDLSRPIGSSCP